MSVVKQKSKDLLMSVVINALLCQRIHLFLCLPQLNNKFLYAKSIQISLGIRATYGTYQYSDIFRTIFNLIKLESSFYKRYCLFLI